MTDEATPLSEAAPVSLPEIARRLAEFEGRITQRLDSMGDTIGAMAQTLAGPILAAETALQLQADAPEGETPGFLGGIAHKVADMAKGAVGAFGRMT